MSRPRKVSDDDVFAAAHRAMTRLGPHELTLAEIASEAGVTAGALVQRFGSRRGLMIALAERHAGASGGFIASLAAQHASHLTAVRAYADCMAGMASSPEALARSLAYLQIDLIDPDLRTNLLKQAEATRDGLQKLVAAAIKAGELTKDVNVRRLTRTIETAITGSLMTWATHQTGPALKWMRDDLDAVLAPWLRKAASGKRRPATGRSSRARR